MSLPNKQAADLEGVHLMTSLRTKAEEASLSEGVSLDEFVNVAVAEKLAYRAHIEWVNSRTPVDPAAIARAIELLRNGPDVPPLPGDELPEGYKGLKDPKAA